TRPLQEMPVVEVGSGVMPIRTGSEPVMQASIMPVGSVGSGIETIPGTPQSSSNQVRQIPVTVAPQQEVVIAPESVGAKERTIAINSVDVHYGQADNYKTITGQVETYRKTLRLRFTSIDQEDPFGGVVVLDGGAELAQLRDGQHIRVVGTMIPAESRTASA